MKIKIRRYRPEDLDELSALFYDTVHSVNIRDYTKTQVNAWTGRIDKAEWNESFLSHNTLVAVDGEKIVGFGDMSSDGYLDRLYVHKDRQRCGIATALCDRLEKSVRSESYTVRSSLTAKPFFLQRGYETVREEDTELNGVPLKSFVMEKKRLRWSDGRQRCFWANPANDLYVRYHDEEWGVPTYDDGKLFEMLLLESFQAGLTWECVLNKREAFRRAFDGFDHLKIRSYDGAKIEELMQNPELIRNRRKINAAITNAAIFEEIRRQYGTFARYLWSFSDNKVIRENDKTHSELSDRLSADLQKRGMTFVGTTIMYAYLQAVGVIDSHLDNCFLHRSADDE